MFYLDQEPRTDIIMARGDVADNPARTMRIGSSMVVLGKLLLGNVVGIVIAATARYVHHKWRKRSMSEHNEEYVEEALYRLGDIQW